MKIYPPNFFVIRHVKNLYAFVLLQLYVKDSLFHTPWNTKKGDCILGSSL